jgi:fumarate reductase flavoprotein subunit
MEWTLWTPNADLVRNYINTSGEVPYWLEKMGAPVTIMTERPSGIFDEEPPPGSGGFLAARDTAGMCMLKPAGKGHGGALMIKAMVKKAGELGVDIRYSTPGKKILKVGNRITGVYAEDKSGNTVHVDAGAVVVATAGFNEDPEMIKKYSGFEFTLDRFGNCEEGDYFNLCPTLNTPETASRWPGKWVRTRGQWVSLSPRQCRGLALSAICPGSC